MLDPGAVFAWKTTTRCVKSAHRGPALELYSNLRIWSVFYIHHPSFIFQTYQFSICKNYNWIFTLKPQKLHFGGDLNLPPKPSRSEVAVLITAHPCCSNGPLGVGVKNESIGIHVYYRARLQNRPQVSVITNLGSQIATARGGRLTVDDQMLPFI